MSSWKINRKEGRVAVKVPIRMEILGGPNVGKAHPFDAFAEDISRNGFRLYIPPDTATPVELAAGCQYDVRIEFGNKRMNGMIQVVWVNETSYGIEFMERDKGWIIN